MVLFTPTIVPSTSKYAKLDRTVGNAPNLAKGGIVGSTRPLSQFSPNSDPPPQPAALTGMAGDVGSVKPGVSMVGPGMKYQRSALGTYTPLPKGFAADRGDVVEGWPTAVDPFMHPTSLEQDMVFPNIPETKASMQLKPTDKSVGYQRMTLGTYTADFDSKLQ